MSLLIEVLNLWRSPHHQRIQEAQLTDQYLAYDSQRPQSVKRGIVKCLYERANVSYQNLPLSPMRKNTCHLFWFLMVIHFLSCRNLPRPENQTTVPNPPTSSRLLWFYLMSKVCSNIFAVVYNNKAYALFSRSETTLRSQLLWPKDAVDPAKQDGVVYRIHCECGKVYIVDWKTYARQNWGARPRHLTRPYRDLRCLRACSQHRTQTTLERSKIYWSWPL